MKTTLMIVLTALLCVSCAGKPRASKLNALALGMPKAEAIDKMGVPASTRASEGLEYLIYHLKDAQHSNSEYFIQIKDGKVAAYGRTGDFNSTAPDVKKIVVDQHVTNH